MIGFYRYEDTAKGEAMDAKDYFVKVILEAKNRKILGAHILGKDASILIHEVLIAMRTEGTASPVKRTVHIHPALSEVVQRAFFNVE